MKGEIQLIFKVDGKERELNFGVRFVAELDETEKYSTEGIEFGMGLVLTQQKLEMGNLGALAKIIKYALYKYNFTLDEIYDALDEYAEEKDLGVLIEKVEGELKNSNAVQTALAGMEKLQKEAKRKQGVQAVKPTKK